MREMLFAYYCNNGNKVTFVLLCLNSDEPSFVTLEGDELYQISKWMVW
jgi:hypothetical protein